MGSNQSVESQNDKNAALPNDPSTISQEAGGASKTSKSNRSKKNNLSGFPLIQHKCRRKKAAYDKCHTQWYQGLFITGKDIDRDEDCDDLFDDYRECILRGMKKDREKRGLQAAAEGSILAEVDDE